MQQDPPPLFSVVIPTHNRTSTLIHTVSTVLRQDYCDFEIIISDNGTTDRVSSIRHILSDPRIKIHDHSEFATMTANFEAGIAKAKGSYIIVIGDDDALMPGSLKAIRNCIEVSNSPIIYWPVSIYFWPIGSSAPRFIPATSQASNWKDIWSIARTSSFLGDILNHKLPSCYHCAVSNSLYQTVRTEKGFVLSTQAPDLFAAYMLPYYSRLAYFHGEPLTINGRSKNSNSGVGYYQGGTNAWNSFVDQYKDYIYHQMISPKAPSALNHVLDVACVARDNFPDLYNNKCYVEASWARLVNLVRSDNTLRENGTLYYNFFDLYYPRKPFSTLALIFYFVLLNLYKQSAKLVRSSALFLRSTKSLSCLYPIQKDSFRSSPVPTTISSLYLLLSQRK